MRRFFRTMCFVLMTFMSVTFLSCGTEYPSEGYFTVDGVNYILNEARLEDVGYADGYYQLRLTMDNTSHNDFHSINFLLYSEVNNYLPSGLYTHYKYDEVYEHRFKRGGTHIGNSIETVIAVGSVKVTKSNEIYTIRIDCEDVNGKDINGYYNGEIKVVI